MAQLESEKSDGSLSIGINSKLSPEWIANVCNGGKRRFKVKSWILVEEEQGYLPLLKDSTLGKMIGSNSAKFCQEEG